MSTPFTPPVEGEKREFKVVPVGTHIARCISWIDIGTVQFDWQGETKELRKIRLSFETPNEKAVFNEENGEQPFVVSTELTLSFHEKANYSKLLSSWFGKNNEEIKKLNPEKDIIGKPCLINISHETTAKGNTFAKIQTVSPLMKGTECPEQVNKSTYFFMGYNGHHSEFDDEVFAKFPKFLKEKIMASPEYGFAHDDLSKEEIIKILS